MRRSSMPARIITALFAVVVAPIGAGLLSAGGRAWYYTFTAFGGFDTSRLLGPVLLQAVGILLLLAVVATGFWSSAGLLTVGILALASLVFAIFPSLLLSMYQAPLPQEWVDGIVYGIPLALFLAFGAMGLVLLLARRSPARPRMAMNIVGLVAAPVLLTVGIGLLAFGISRGMLVALQQYRFDVSFDAIAAVLSGAVLVVAGVMTTRWSPFALLLPAVVLLVLTPLSLSPGSGFQDVLFTLSREMSRSVPPLLVMGAGVAAALAYALFTAVLLRARAQNRILPGTYVAPLGADGYPLNYPAPGPAAAPQPYAPGQPYPPAPPYQQGQPHDPGHPYQPYQQGQSHQPGQPYPPAQGHPPTQV
ncbi:hypothetical protein ACFY5A_07575 [Microbacterium sp. NPDC012755]|uniref:hypothetical protein n=1 Tax=Microbacterium sp. NPDC012755 TaxID=3364184 RepID=UPI00368984BE